MPAKGYKKGYVKDPETGEWMPPTAIKKKISVEVAKPEPKKKKAAPMKTVTDDKQNAKVIIIWREGKKEKTRRYTMHDLEVSEDLSESYGSAGNRTVQCRLSIEGTVLEKL